MPNRLSIIVVEKDRDRALQIVDSLNGSGDYDISVIAEESGLSRRIAQRDPDVVLIDMTDPSRDALEELALASGPLDRPVAMFVDRSDDALTKAAIEPGESFTYRFPLKDAGTFWYHTHSKGWEQLARGLYGPLVVPKPNCRIRRAM